MRLWNSSRSEEIFANIPELPGPSDKWNINTLMSLDGKMQPFWVNLYGIHPEDRGKKGINLLHASSFMGRILMSLHLMWNVRPQYMISSCHPGNEPRVKSYQLWIDVYDLFNCDDILNREPVWVLA